MWLFSWAAAIVLVVSFVALSTLWTHPQLQRRTARAACSAPPDARVRMARRACSASALFALVLYSGFAGTQVAGGELLA